MLPHVTDVTALTNTPIAGKVSSWLTGAVEHLAGRGPNDRLYVFFRQGEQPWQVDDVTELTAQTISQPPVAWTVDDGANVVERIAAVTTGGDLVVVSRKLGAWTVENLTTQTGHQVNGPLTAWVTPNGPAFVDHVAGVTAGGDLIVFWLSSQGTWKAVNVSDIAGKQVQRGLTSWQTANGPHNVEHVAGVGTDGHALVFWWSPAADWQVVDATADEDAGSPIDAPPCSWVTDNGNFVVEHLASPDPNGRLRVLWWSPAAGHWRNVDVERYTGDFVAGAPTAYQLQDAGGELNELLVARTPDGHLLRYWWKPSLDWQSMDLTEATGETFASDPEAYVVHTASPVLEVVAATTAADHLLVIESDDEWRRLVDDLSRPFLHLERSRGSAAFLAILWDYQHPTHVPPPVQEVQDALTSATQNVRGYFLENSNDHWDLQVVGVEGWYPSDHPHDYYGTPHPEWNNPHHQKYPEAIDKAQADFDFSSWDTSGDGTLEAGELGIGIFVPGTGTQGFVRGVNLTEIPPELLTIDGVTYTQILEVYIATPVAVGLLAHEVSHLLLGTGDMYYTFAMPGAAGPFSLMDQHMPHGHLDPFHKLKLGWLRPHIIQRSGNFELEAVSQSHKVYVLMDPARGADEYFVLEVRHRGTSYDDNLPDEGLVVWHVIEDPNLWPTAPPPDGTDMAGWNALGAGEWARRCVRVIRPVPGVFDASSTCFNGADPATGYDLLPEDPNPAHNALAWADGTPSGFAIRNISASGPVMTFDVEVGATGVGSGCLTAFLDWVLGS